MSKKKSKIKEVLGFFWKHIQSIIILIGSVILSVFVIKEHSRLKGLKKTKWKKIHGTKTKVQVQNENKKWEEVILPIINGIQITTDNVKDIRKTEKEGEYAAKIKHEIRDRRNNIITSITITDDNTSMDI